MMMIGIGVMNVVWRCSACSLRVDVPCGRPDLMGERVGFCEACFAKHGAGLFVRDDEVEQRLQAIRTRLLPRILEQVAMRVGKPKPRFVELGLSDQRARAAADAWGALQMARLKPEHTRVQAAATCERALVDACLEASFGLLDPAEAELLRKLEAAWKYEHTAWHAALGCLPYVTSPVRLALNVARAATTKHVAFYVPCAPPPMASR